MAKIKKISELEQLSSLSSSSNVIIEENGKAKRIAASNLDGKVKTVNGIEPDENGNVQIKIAVDSSAPPVSGGVTSWNDLTDKPFYSEMVTIMEEQSITTMDNDGSVICQFSELLPLEVGCTVAVYYNGVKYEGVIKEAKIQGFLPIAYFGDVAITEGRQTEGEHPFILFTSLMSDGNLSGFGTPSVETCTIRVDIENVVKISDKYIPKQEIKHPIRGSVLGDFSYNSIG